MFRKIRSDSAPERTIWSDIGDEIRPYLDQIAFRSKLLIHRFPRTFFVCMVLAIVYSIMHSFSLEKSPKAAQAQQVLVKSDQIIGKTLGNGFDRISSTADALRISIVLQRHIDSVLQKKQLSAMDSLFLDSALQVLKQNPLQ